MLKWRFRDTCLLLYCVQGCRFASDAFEKASAKLRPSIMSQPAEPQRGDGGSSFSAAGFSQTLLVVLGVFPVIA